MRKLHDLLSLDGKVAFITGGAGYLGTAMCETLAELGATVVVASRDGAKCQTLADRLTADYGTAAAGISTDLTQPESVRAALAETVSRYGKLDILINNAAAIRKNSFESISYEDWHWDVDMTLNTVFNTCKEATDYLKLTRGVILNTSSMYGHVAPDYRIYEDGKLVNSPSYGAAKAGILQLTRYLASFLSPHGIRANAISPGPFPFPQTGLDFPTFYKTLEGKTMLGRVGVPEDLKGVTALLCSDASRYITGQNYCIDGGWASW